MNTGLNDLLEKFVALGGIVDNVCQKEGEFGRGIFPIDPSRRSEVMTPVNLLINRDNLAIYEGEILIKDKTCFASEESAFIEMYYNDYSWGNNGNSDSINYLKFISTTSQSVKHALVDHGFVSNSILGFDDSPQCVFERFVDERAFKFEGDIVLAPVMELLNHSAYASPFRVVSGGLRSPLFQETSSELLHKYSGKNSSMSIWSKYGFACRCIVAYSVPLKIEIKNESLCISCLGRFGMGPNDDQSFSLVGDSISIKSLPVGCLSPGLPFAAFNSILCSVGLSADVAKRLFPKVLELNLKARRDLLGLLQEPGFGAQAELYKALAYEIDLIEASLVG